MSDHDEVMERLDWLVKAVGYLLKLEPVDPEVPTGPVERPPDDAPPVQDTPVTNCLHNQQAIIDGYPTCAKCGTRLGPRSGVVGKNLQPGEAPWLARPQ
jgi:hypothetical protein